jgi:hypothetical protein
MLADRIQRGIREGTVLTWALYNLQSYCVVCLLAQPTTRVPLLWCVYTSPFLFLIFIINVERKENEWMAK